MSATTEKSKFRRGVAIFKKYLAPYRAALTVISIFSLADAGANALTPLLAGKIFDALISPRDISLPGFGVVTAALAFIAIWFLVRVVGDIAGWQKSVRQERFSADLHADYLIAAFSRA